MTSLTFTPCASFTARTSASATDEKASSRRGPSVALKTLRGPRMAARAWSAARGRRAIRRLPGAAGRRHRDATHVTADVEVGVVDPDRPVEVERDVLQLPTELRGLVDPLRRAGHDLIEGEAASRRVEDREATDVLVP